MQPWELSKPKQHPHPNLSINSWGLAPIHVLQSLFPPLAGEPEHLATLGVLGCRISILFIVKYFCSVGFGFFLLLQSLTSHLSPSSDSQFAHQGMMSTFPLLIPSDFAICCLSSYSSLSSLLHSSLHGIPSHDGLS